MDRLVLVLSSQSQWWSGFVGMIPENYTVIAQWIHRYPQIHCYSPWLLVIVSVTIFRRFLCACRVPERHP